MLSKEQIEINKGKFIKLLRSIQRENSAIEELIDKLENSDFFTAPASTQYHSSFEGGLCQHSLNVFDQLVKLVDAEYPATVVDAGSEKITLENKSCPISMDSILIVSLLHDISKMNFYETSYRNAKDEAGNWVKVPFIKTREAKDRFLYSTHGVNSEYMVGRFIPLSLEESVAIINHMGGKEAGAPQFDGNLTEIFNRYPLALLLHCADMIATFKDESLFNQE